MTTYKTMLEEIGKRLLKTSKGIRLSPMELGKDYFGAVSIGEEGGPITFSSEDYPAGPLIPEMKERLQVTVEEVTSILKGRRYSIDFAYSGEHDIWMARIWDKLLNKDAERAHGPCLGSLMSYMLHRALNQ